MQKQNKNTYKLKGWDNKFPYIDSIGEDYKHPQKSLNITSILTFSFKITEFHDGLT